MKLKNRCPLCHCVHLFAEHFGQGITSTNSATVAGETATDWRYFDPGSLKKHLKTHGVWNTLLIVWNTMMYICNILSFTHFIDHPSISKMVVAQLVEHQNKQLVWLFSRVVSVHMDLKSIPQAIFKRNQEKMDLFHHLFLLKHVPFLTWMCFFSSTPHLFLPNW